MVTKKNGANAPKFVEGSCYAMNPTGFRYVKDFAIICGTCKGVAMQAIIGDKQSFGIRDMFQLKECTSLEVTYKGTKEVNGVVYARFVAGTIKW